MKRIIALALSALFLQSCPKKETVDYFETSVASVKVLEAKAQQYTDRIETFGTAVFEKKSDVSAVLEGNVKSMKADIGQYVTEGQILAELGNVQLTIQQAQAQTALETAIKAEQLAASRYSDALAQMEAQFIRFEKTEIEKAQKKKELDRMIGELQKQQELYDLGGVPAQTVRDAQFQYDAALISFQLFEKDSQIASIGFRDEDITSKGYKIPATYAERVKLLKIINTQTVKAEWDAAKTAIISAQREKQSVDEMVRELTVRSPMNGLVGARMIEQGERTQNGTKMFTVFDSKKVFVVFNIEAGQVRVLKEGMTVNVSFDALGDTSFIAKLTLISPTVDSASGSVALKAVLDNPDGSILPGMFARITIDTNAPRQTIFLPETVIARKDGSKATVFVVTGEKAFAREVSLGIFDEGQYEIAGGLKSGDKVIDFPPPNLKEGQNVENAK